MFPASISILCMFDFSSVLSRVAPRPTPLFLHYVPITIHRQRYSFRRVRLSSRKFPKRRGNFETGVRASCVTSPDSRFDFPTGATRLFVCPVVRHLLSVAEKRRNADRFEKCLLFHRAAAAEIRNPDISRSMFFIASTDLGIKAVLVHACPCRCKFPHSRVFVYLESRRSNLEISVWN